MKTKFFATLILAAVFFSAGCKKEGLFSGTKKISGKVYYYDGVNAKDNLAKGATVYISYGTKTFTGTIDETVTSDAKGEYMLRSLKKDDYFVWGEYTTSHGFNYTTPGHGLTINADSKENTSLNLRLY